MYSTKVHQVKELLSIQSLTLSSLLCLDLRIPLKDISEILSTALSQLGAEDFTQLLIESSRSRNNSLQFVLSYSRDSNQFKKNTSRVSVFGVHRCEDSYHSYFIKMHNIKTELYRDKEGSDLLNRFKYTGVGSLNQKLRSNQAHMFTLKSFIQKNTRLKERSIPVKSPKPQKPLQVQEEFMEEEYVKMPSYNSGPALVSIEMMNSLKDVNSLDDIFSDDLGNSQSDVEILPAKRSRPYSDSDTYLASESISTRHSSRAASLLHEKSFQTAPSRSVSNSISSNLSSSPSNPHLKLPYKKSKRTQAYQPVISSFFRNN